MSETQPTTSPPAEQTKALTAEVQFRNELTKMQPQFAMVLPSHISPDKFARVAMTAALLNPNFLKPECRKTLIQELMKCATDGLIPDGREAAMVPYKGQPKYVPMVGGILKKCRNSGDLKSIHPMVVYENDEFKHWVDENGPHLQHVPTFERDPGKPRLTYAVAQTKDGGTYMEIITESQMDKIRKASPAGDNGPWGGSFIDEMRKKSAIKRLSKRLPSSTDLDQLLERDEEITDPRELQPHATPIQYQTIDVGPQATAEPPAADPVTQPKQVYNHAPGSSNPPPPTDPVPDQPAAKAAAAPNDPAPDQKPATTGPDRKSISLEIYKMCRDLNVDMKKKVYELTKVEDPTKLTINQMVDMHTCLEIELANLRGEKD